MLFVFLLFALWISSPHESSVYEFISVGYVYDYMAHATTWGVNLSIFKREKRQKETDKHRKTYWRGK